MSRIWDLLRNVELRQNVSASRKGVGAERQPVRDRRCTPRIWIYSPVLVYGHATENEPFHEGTEALHVNARGGLITLRTAVGPGQTLLLFNKVNQKEQKCTVVRQTSAYLNWTTIVVQFSHPAPDFWDTTQLLK
ncbi:MAG TPA: hypothetical protein VNE63_05315 [Candidatus Acidoferrales bacterium]|nr:hypothetical protein [Candidatus Acidoferrales bacterium]